MSTNTKRRKKNDKPGTVASYFSGVAKVTGLSGVFLNETLVDRDGHPVALVVGFDSEYVEVLFFDDLQDLDAPLFRSEQEFTIPVSDSSIGRVLDGLGYPRDNLGPVTGDATPVFCRAPRIIDRQPVTTPLSTGITIIDTALSLGRGQRELILGDRKLGKSTIATDTVLNQKHATPPVYCVYVVCGQKTKKVQDLIKLFEKHAAFLHTVVVAATAEDSYAAQYLAPFVGSTIGEYFRDQGKDALVVYDDLSKHASVYRSIALLLERAPGRESYPGEIFSLHAGLLERAAKLSDEQGGGSLTALPIIETQEGDITSFIPTNLISITDGQVYFERGLFQKGFLPAINVGLSVSRIGSQVQPEALREVVGSIRLSLSQYKELQKLTQLETTMSKRAKTKIHRGDLTLELLKQENETNISWPEQVVLFHAVEHGLFDDMNKEMWKDFESMLLELVRNRYQDVLASIEKEKMTGHMRSTIQKIVKDAKREFAPQQ